MRWDDDAEILTPTTTNQAVASRLRELRGLRVRGEVSQPRRSGGHLYFELKDRSARLRAVIWRSTLQRLRLDLRDGDDVICTGDLDLWVQGGTYSLVVQRVERGGIGAAFAALQRLRAQLQEEGLFDPARKKPLPKLPRTVGVVTAQTGAALRDILRVLHDRFPVRVVVTPARVQGQGASAEIADALLHLDRSGLCDVIIVGRGGGSIEDLWAFNEEPVARAIAACRTPVVSAVGHETDTLLSDLVADVRAPTPTAAAEMVVPRHADLLGRIAELRRRLGQRMQRLAAVRRREWALLDARVSGDRLTAERRRAVDALLARIERAERAERAAARRRLALLTRRLTEADPRQRLAAARRRHQQLTARLQSAGAALGPRRRLRHTRVEAALLAQAQRIATPRRARFATLRAQLRALDPKSALHRGFAIVRRPEDGRALRDAAEAELGGSVEILLAHGGLQARVEARLPEPASGTEETPR